MGISERTLRRMVLEGSFPKPLEKMLPRVRWSKVTILRWVEENG
jgi:predicted DNA-binding transcriptional regulator AlpA